MVHGSHGPVVGYANWYQFAPSEELHIRRVESRMILWCRHGRGTITVDGGMCRIQPGLFHVLPWGHRIEYRAESRNPFMLGGVHVIPHGGQPFRFGISHAPDDSLAGDPSRSDVTGFPVHDPRGRSLSDYPILTHLISYIAERWSRQAPTEAEARSQGHLLVRELLELRTSRTNHQVPTALQRLSDAVLQKLDRNWDVATLAAIIGCRSAWLSRLTGRHWQATPMRWLESMRLERARSLLLEPNLSIQDVGVAVGIDDPARFSKRFKLAYGQSPRAWRMANRSLY